MEQKRLLHTLYQLDAWLQSMRDERGYCGPITHWWQSCLLYAGAMADWRYEGLVCGYVNLYRATQQPLWLDRAIVAGHDLVRAQLPSGQFWNSGFEVGPLEGGTPHEAAVDVALLELSKLLRSNGDPRWQVFFGVAERNIRAYQLGCLWNGRAFRDQPWNTTLVPNKNATTMEALLLYEELSGCSMQEYIHGAAHLILSAQVSAAGPRQGATIHLGSGPYQLAIGIYTARCAAALVRIHQHYPSEAYLQAARAMVPFLERLVVGTGTHFGMYVDGRPIVCPTWVSASGDILRALIMLRPYANVREEYVKALACMLAERQLRSGGIPTAIGLGRKGRTAAPGGKPDFRDLVPVVGWCDKAFRALTMLVDAPGAVPDQQRPGEAALACTWKGRDCLFLEDAERMRLVDQRRDKVLYDWRKGDCYPATYQL